MNAAETFGKNLNRLRAESELTQEKLAELAEIDRSYLQRLEAGTSCPTIETAARIKAALNVEWNELLEGIEK